MKVATLLKAWSILGSIRNRILNTLATAGCGTRVAVDWRDLKIVHPEKIQIGNNFCAGRSLWLESVKGQGVLIIGNDVNLSDWVHIACATRVEIQDGVLIGSKVLISDHSHGKIDQRDGIGELHTHPNLRTIHSKGPITIGRSVWIGDGTCILANVIIGDFAIVGANSIVLCDIPSGSIWAGTPARQLRSSVGTADSLSYLPQ